MPVKKAKDPLRSAAILKVSLKLSGDSPQYLALYQGVLRDTGVKEADVDAYIEKHRAELEQAARGRDFDGDEPDKA
ncbi:MAG: hypothetical protein JST54_18525 [Deltaproteobacteria bacterium]|nr:hypothetical protein [Deltaproteobacteria bacterium]